MPHIRRQKTTFIENQHLTRKRIFENATIIIIELRQDTRQIISYLVNCRNETIDTVHNKSNQPGQRNRYSVGFRTRRSRFPRRGMPKSLKLEVAAPLLTFGMKR